MILAIQTHPGWDLAGHDVIDPALLQIGDLGRATLADASPSGRR